MSTGPARSSRVSPLYDKLDALIGGRAAKALDRAFGMRTVGDLLRHYPRRYIDQRTLTEFGSLQEGEFVTLLAEVVEAKSRPMRQRRGTISEVIVTDGHGGRLSLTFFNQKWREGAMHPGTQVLVAGKASRFAGRLQLTHPQLQSLSGDGADIEEQLARGMLPIYPATSTLTSWQIMRMVDLALQAVATLPDPIPEGVRTEHGLVDLATALRLIHRPVDLGEVEQARARLRFEEAFVLQTVIAIRRAELLGLPAVPRFAKDEGLLAAFDARLPFALTSGQQDVAAQIEHDMARSHPMHRLLQGDVGSGKTIVALRAMLAVVDSGAQAALLAPTEVLAAQHYHSITELMGPLAQGGRLGGADVATRVSLLTGSQKAARKRSELLDIATGSAGIVIGTHALLEDIVMFDDLGLVVVDEQHRFGVEQRAALAGKAQDFVRPHVLVMTATPIPRTIAMTVFGDLDTSTLTELPAGRMPVKTVVVPMRDKPRYVDRAWELIREQVGSGHRAFIVCPRIGDGDAGSDEEIALTAPPAADRDDERDDEPGILDGTGDGTTPVEEMASVIETARRLAAGPLAGLRVGILHGRMPSADKDDAMARFADTSRTDGIDVLVATTVIEVGVDVPDATVMVIMDADRFGISQLHQMRGRIGRGSLPGTCLLMTNAPEGSPGRERLDAVASTTDGFVLAEEDLKLRREGDVLGAAQSGRRSSLRLLRVIDDAAIIADARDAASGVVADDPALVAHPALRAAVDDIIDTEQAEYVEKS